MDKEDKYNPTLFSQYYSKIIAESFSRVINKKIDSLFSNNQAELKDRTITADTTESLEEDSLPSVNNNDQIQIKYSYALTLDGRIENITQPIISDNKEVIKEEIKPTGRKFIVDKEENDNAE